LPLGAEVTVNGEFAGEKVNMSSFWATVTKVVSLEDEVHEVTDAHDNTHIINQSAFRHRSRQSVACGHITDDKVHDRHAMQHFTNHALKYLED